MKKNIMVGLAAGLIMLITAMIVSTFFQFTVPSVKTEYQDTSIFRPWSDPVMLIYFLHPFILGIILAWLWNIIKPVIKGNSAEEKGVYFGLSYWVVTIPGMIISYSSFQVSLILVLTWTVSLFAQSMAAGLFFSKTLK